MIEQAKGIIIAEQGCSADEAFQLLVTTSQRSHMKLHDLATELFERARDRAAAGGQDQDRGSR
jgi:AmiR/NasT family two-component response regulator